LEPILFLIYINERLDNGVKNWILKFADDTKIFCAVNSDLDRSVLQKDLDNLLRWAEEWQMLFSVLKARCYFPSAADRKVSKREAIFRPPRTEKEEHVDAIFRPCVLWL